MEMNFAAFDLGSVAKWKEYVARVAIKRRSMLSIFYEYC